MARVAARSRGRTRQAVGCPSVLTIEATIARFAVDLKLLGGYAVTTDASVLASLDEWAIPEALAKRIMGEWASIRGWWNTCLTDAQRWRVTKAVRAWENPGGLFDSGLGAGVVGGLTEGIGKGLGKLLVAAQVAAGGVLILFAIAAILVILALGTDKPARVTRATVRPVRKIGGGVSREATISRGRGALRSAREEARFYRAAYEQTSEAQEGTRRARAAKVLPRHEGLSGPRARRPRRAA